jgi:GNAT superfamily N-acetyltransferase
LLTEKKALTPEPHLKFKSLTPENWPEFEKLFGPKGACGGCWCMWWRLKRSDFEKQKGEENKQAMKKLVRSGKIPGILVYLNDQPIAWCSIASRKDFILLDRSRVLKPIDDKPVWSVICLFVTKPFRRRGITPSLLRAAITFASENGAKIIEGYPIDTKKDNYPVVFASTGLYPAFIKAGFKECARRSKTRPIMRFFIEEEIQ